MGFFRLWGKALTYPFTRTYKDTTQSFRNMRESVKEVKRLRQEQLQDQVAAERFLAHKEASEKFQTVYELNQWDEVQLSQQLIAVHRSRIMLTVLAVLVFFLFFVVLLKAPLWTLMIFLALGIFAPAICIGMAAKYAWHEWQIVNRQLIAFSAFLKKDWMRLLLQFSTYKPEPVVLHPDSDLNEEGVGAGSENLADGDVEEHTPTAQSLAGVEEAGVDRTSVASTHQESGQNSPKS